MLRARYTSCAKTPTCAALTALRGIASLKDGTPQGYRPLHNLADVDLPRDKVEEELWFRVSMIDKIVTQVPLHGGLFLAPVMFEALEHLDAVGRHIDNFGFGEDEELKSALYHLRCKAKAIERTFEMERESVNEWV